MGKGRWTYLAMALSQDKLDYLACSNIPAPEEYECISSEDERYNCLAWAVGIDSVVWIPNRLQGMRGLYWPIRSSSLKEAEVVEAYNAVGFVRCDGPDLQDGKEKIALFFDEDGDIIHAAWQRKTGVWSSKLSTWEDVDHANPALFEGLRYGRIRVFMVRDRVRFD